jgi:hypothetical protein
MWSSGSRDRRETFLNFQTADRRIERIQSRSLRITANISWWAMGNSRRRPFSEVIHLRLLRKTMCLASAILGRLEVRAMTGRWSPFSEEVYNCRDKQNMTIIVAGRPNIILGRH